MVKTETDCCAVPNNGSTSSRDTKVDSTTTTTPSSSHVNGRCGGSSQVTDTAAAAGIGTLAFAANNIHPNKAFEGVRLTAWELVPAFRALNKDDIAVRELTGGITNKLFLCSHDGTQVLVRVYGAKTEVLIDRNLELKIIVEAGKRNMGPHMFGHFINGYVYSFREGTVLTPEELPAHSTIIARKLARWHALDIPVWDENDKEIVSNSLKKASLFKTLRSWIRVVRECKFTDPVKEHAMKQLDIDRIENEMNKLEPILSSLSDVVFCHNDLLAGNIILCKSAVDPICFIDFEYCGHNFRHFDIANHFVEWTGFELNYDRFPTPQQTKQFLAEYFLIYNNGTEPTEEMLEHACSVVFKFTLASHLFWGLWACAQASFSELDFNFIEYAGIRLRQYFNDKPRFLDASDLSKFTTQ